MSGGRVFLDSNIVVYVFDERTPSKQRLAGELIQKLAEAGTARVISTQVLQEAYSAMTSKLRLDPTDALTLLQKVERSGVWVEAADVPLIWRAANRSIADKISFWDGLIVESAIAARCSVLYSEDMQHGRAFNNLTVVNPFIQ